MQKRGAAVLGGVLFLSIAIISGVHGAFAWSFVSLLILIPFLLTALPLTRRIFGSGRRAVVFALPAGFLVHALLLSLLGWLFGVKSFVLLPYIVACVAIAVWDARKAEPAAEELDKADVMLMLLWMLCCVWATAPAFLNVGRETSAGIAYRAYFNADFFRNLAVAGSISHIGIPPENPYVSGQNLHYYWLFHSFFAFWKSLFPGYRPDFLLVQLSLVVLCAFVGSLFTAIRSYVTSRKTLLLLLPLLILGGSYKSIYILSYLQSLNLPYSRFSDINIEGVLRWHWNAPQVDMLYRAFLYAPQHLVAMCLLPMLLIVHQHDSTRKGRLIAYGLLFAGVGYSIFIAGSLALYAGILLLYRAIRNPGKYALELLVAGAMAVLFAGMYHDVFEMFQFGAARLLDFGIPGPIQEHFFRYTVLNWGILLPLGIAGIFLNSQKAPAGLLACWLLFCLMFIYSVKLHLPGSSDISLKQGYLTAAILLCLSAGFLDRFWAMRYKKLLAVPLCILLVPAALTWGMEVFNTQDIHNAKFTSYIPYEDAEMLQWMRKNLPDKSVVQYFGAGKGYLNEFVTEVPALAERPVFLGDKNFTVIFQTSKEVVDARTSDTWNLYNEEAPAGVYAACLKLGIDHIFLGTRTLETARDFRQELVEPFFSIAHSNGEAVVFQRNDGLTVQEKELDSTVLLAEEGKAVLRATFDRNLFPREVRQGKDTGRWMSNNAQISLVSSKVVHGRLEFTALPLGKSRDIEIFLNEEMVLRKPVPAKGATIQLPLSLSPGINKLRIDCPTGAEPAANYSHNGDQRLLSIRLFRLRFLI